MRRMLAPFLALLILIPAGCASTPAPENARERLVVAEASYAAALEEIFVLTEGGVIEGQTAGRVATVVRATRAALNEWHTDPDNPDFALVAIRAVAELGTLVTEFTGGDG